MAAFEAVERLQKFDWLIQKLHSLRNTFNSDQGIQELQKLHALQLLHRNGIQFNESIGDNEEERILEEKITGDEEEVLRRRGGLTRRLLATTCEELHNTSKVRLIDSQT